MDDLDATTFTAAEAVVARLLAGVDSSSSLERMRLLMAKAQMLRAMLGTHRSIRRLIKPGEDLELAVDALPLTRVQLERCFLALLIEDQPNRWFKRYRKNAWKAFAEKFFRDRCAVGHIEGFSSYFAPDGEGIRILRDFAREMDVWEDELQTLRIGTTGDDPDPRFPPRYIADMPTPGRAVGILNDALHKRLAELLYPFYATLSHFSHGGLVGVMQSAVLRSELPDDVQTDRQQFYRANILETTAPASYVAILFVATLQAGDLTDSPAVRQLLLEAWKPYHSDGSLLGIAVWDNWAREIIEGPDQPAD